MTWYLIALATAAALLLIFTILAIMYVYHRLSEKPHKRRINAIITHEQPDSRSAPLGEITHRQMNPQASLGEGIKRAEQRKSYLRRDD